MSLDLWGTILDDNHSPADTITYSTQRQNFLGNELTRHGQAFAAKDMKAAYQQAWNHFDALWAKQIAFGAADGVREMLRLLGAKLPEESMARVVRFFEETFDEHLPPSLDDAMPAVKRLASRYALALISDTAWTPGRVLRTVLQRHGVAGFFVVMVFSGEVGVTKPHRRMFELALEGLGVQPQACLHVGDLQRTDVAGARQAGMRAAWLYRPVYAGAAQEDNGAEVVVSSVMELAERMLMG